MVNFFQIQHTHHSCPSKLHNSPHEQKETKQKTKQKECFSCQNLNEDAQLEISTESKKKVLHNTT